MRNDLFKYVITTIIGAVLASCIAYTKQLKDKIRKNIKENKEEDIAVREAVKMLLRADLKAICRYYIEKGEITTAEYEELEEELKVYEEFNGNGVVHRLFDGVKEIKII